ncbi:reverse transcriptase RNA-dependent DNA polymerase [Nitzschia inconspicua]|uniref:Reverse transcriptase RNA-dependent DNA polymerase n=1 Tax=Nitzschia inconspicua TaxID=303405 RepID=A0A9K3Q3S3_9STRA|nr:reverse transcriptase RNA-dependent DNA polymerase [Nitzschia inconspicua]
MSWDDVHIPMRSYPADSENFLTNIYLESYEPDFFYNDRFYDNDEVFLTQQEPSDQAETFVQEKRRALHSEGYRSGNILSSKYDFVNADTVVQAQRHLSADQQADLAKLLRKHSRLFSGQLGEYKGQKIHLEIDPSVKPSRSRPYTVPINHQQVFKEELERLVRIGVLEKCGRSEWIAGTFIIPKKDGRIRWISDFRALNKALKRQVYHLPKIGDILARRTNYQFFTKLDVSMQYYTFVLDDESKALTTIATPFGTYRYRRLPMGICQSPDIAQEIMENVLQGLNKDVEVYIDDIDCFSNSWESHIELLNCVLTRLEDAGFTINPLKCEWGVKETDFLGHWLTPTGHKPWKKKVDAILAMQPPSNLKQLRSFLGLVTFYRDMWPHRSHTLAPLTNLLGTKTFSWNPPQQQAFEEMKAIVARDALLAYPDNSLPFDVETDASEYQLGAVIKQNGRPIAYYSRKLNSAQKNYTTIEKELLSIVETFREYRNILLGAQIRVHTDHKNLTHQMTKFTTQRVLRWRLLLDEFGATFHYKKGSTNFIADALSRVPISFPYGKNLTPSDMLHACILADGLLVHPGFDEAHRHPFQFETIAFYQNRDRGLQGVVNSRGDYHRQSYGSTTLITYNKDGEEPKICVPDEMLSRLVKYYHDISAHVEGATRLIQTIKRHFYHPRLAETVQKFVLSCDICQKNKRGSKPYGHLAPRDAVLLPWQEIHCDSIGPWKIDLRARTIEFKAMTIIDPATNLIEIQPLLTGTAKEAADVVEDNWIARYPRPVRCITDNGPEFGQEFRDRLEDDLGVKVRSSTSRNPQGNSIIERVHQSIGLVLRVVAPQQNPQSVEDGKRVIRRCLSTAMHACRCATSGAIGNLSPGSLAFHRDMLLDIPMQADIAALARNRQGFIDKKLLQENAKRIRHDYAIDEKVLKRAHLNMSDKLQPSYTGPYRIVAVHTNGTVTIELKPNIHERVNIRRIKPYRAPSDQSHCVGG